MLEITTRSEAKQRKLKKYWTNKPCIKQHMNFRYTNTGACIECISGYKRKKYSTFRIRLKDPRDLPALQAYADALNLDRGVVL